MIQRRHASVVPLVLLGQSKVYDGSKNVFHLAKKWDTSQLNWRSSRPQTGQGEFRLRKEARTRSDQRGGLQGCLKKTRVDAGKMAAENL